jgi:PKD repeat protein
VRYVKLMTAVCLMALATNAFAAKSPSSTPPPQLYDLDKGSRPAESRWLVPDESEEWAIRVNPETVAANPPAFILELPGLPALEAVRSRFFVYKPDWKSWFGTLRRAGTDEPGTGYIHLGYHGKQLTGYLAFEGERYQIVSTEAGHRLAHLSEELGTPSCPLNVETGKVPNTPATAEPLTGMGFSKAAPAPLAAGGLKLATNRLDVLAVYPKAFFSSGPSAETALTNNIRDAISTANNIFANSSVDAYYNLVGIVPITGSSQPLMGNGLQGALDWLNSGPAEVTNLRNAFGADVVTIFIPFDWSAVSSPYTVPFCGIADLPQSNNTYIGPYSASPYSPVNAPFGDRAFTAVRNGCGPGDFTLAHEIGHNYGMRHDNDNTASPPALFPNGRGYVFPVGSPTNATVMGCFCVSGCAAGTNAVCNRIPYFSDPGIVYAGVPIGDTTHNNAAVGRSQVASYAAFRPQSANTPPTANFTTSCAGRACTFTSTSTDDLAIPSTGYWWDFGDNSTGSLSSTSHTYNSAGTYYVHLVVTDGGGQTGVKEVTVSPTITYEGYHEASTCRAISGWAWDGTPNAPINVDIYRDNGYVTSVSANVYRSDLQSNGKGNGYHAFGYTPDSSWKDGQWHSSLVRFGGTGTSLTWSPRNLICAVSCFPTLTPAENNDTGGVVYTVATQLSSSYSGYITALRFYRASGETGTNVGQLWSDGGSLLAQATFPSSPSSGWVEVALSSPVAVSAGTRYRVAVNTNTRQSKTSCGIGSGITNQVLTAYQGFWIAGNGVFPTTGSCSNFFVDVKFDL